MKILIDACPLLTSLQYVVSPIDSGITFHELVPVEVLRPLHRTLEELYAGIPTTSSGMSTSRLTLLSHFTALRILDTAARMWGVGSFDEQKTKSKASLSSRFPASLERLVFHSNLNDNKMSHADAIKVIKQRAYEFINLKSIAILVTTGGTMESIRRSLDTVKDETLEIQWRLEPWDLHPLRPVFKIISTSDIE
jgi:hypothetical protein